MISQELQKATQEYKEEKVAECWKKLTTELPIKTHRDVATFIYTLRYAYYAAHYLHTMLPEVDTGKEFADTVFIPVPQYSGKPVPLFEL